MCSGPYSARSGGASGEVEPASARKPSPAPFIRMNSRLEADASACTGTAAVIDGIFSTMRRQAAWDGRPRPSCEGAAPGWPLAHVSPRTRGVSGSGHRGDGRGRPSHGDRPRPPGRDRRPAYVRIWAQAGAFGYRLRSVHARPRRRLNAFVFALRATPRPGARPATGPRAGPGPFPSSATPSAGVATGSTPTPTVPSRIPNRASRPPPIPNPRGEAAHPVAFARDPSKHACSF